jgi:hypothetical protein
MRTYGLKTIVLSLVAAIGLMAFTATAQATEELTLKSRHLAILLNSGTVLGIGTTTAVAGKQVGTAILKVPGKNSEIRCEAGAVTEASVENETDTKKNPEGEELTEASESKRAAMGKGKIEFSKCKVFAESTGLELAACTKAFNENNPEGKVVEGKREATPSAKVLVLALLHLHISTIAGEVLEHDISIVRLTPLSGIFFTKLKFGGTCSLPETVEVKGSIATEISQTDAAVQKMSFDGATVAGKAATKDAKTKLSFGANEAFVKGEIEIELEGKPVFGAMSGGEVPEELILKSRHLALLLNSGTVLSAGAPKTAIERQVGTVLLKIPAKNSEIRCEKGAVTEASVENETDTKKNPEGEELTEASESKLAVMGKGKIEFSKCKVFAESTGLELAACTKAFNENNPEGKVVEGKREATPSAKVLVLALLHLHISTIAGEVLEHDISIARLTPLGGGTLFSNLKFGGTCTLPENVEVTGSISTEISQSDAPIQKVTFDAATAEGVVVSKDAKTLLKFGANEAFIKGEIELELEGKPVFGAMSGGEVPAVELTLKSRHLALLLNSGTVLKTGTVTGATGTQVGTVILKIPFKGSELRCERGTVTEASVENETDTKKNPEGEELTEASTSAKAVMGKGRIEFSKCKVFAESTGAELANCTAAFNANNPEKIGSEAAPSAKVLVLSFLHFHKSTIAGEVLEHDISIARLTPLSGGIFTKLKFGGLCTALPENVEVTGSIATEIPTTDAVKQKVVFDTASAAGKAITKEAKTKLSFGGNEAFIKGELEVELEGAPNWGVM